MIGLYIVTAIGLVISYFLDAEKTVKGIKIGWKKFSKTLPTYLKLLMIISVVFFFTEGIIIEYLSQGNLFIGLVAALLLGSITMLPGFIAYPIAKILIEKGVSYTVVAALVTSLMLVGIMTFPLEKKYFGSKATIMRNIMSLIISGLIAIIMGIFYGEVMI